MNTILKQNPDWLGLAKQANWSVEKLAKLCEVSSRTLQLHFIKIMDQSPKSWLTEQRQRQASELLRGGVSVKQTAADLGYRHSNHFSREFKRHWGYCPTQIATTADKFRISV